MTDRRTVSAASSSFVHDRTASGIPDLTWVMIGLVLGAPAYLVGADDLLLSGVRGFIKYPASDIDITMSLHDFVTSTDLVSLTFPAGSSTPVRLDGSFTLAAGSIVAPFPTSPPFITEGWGMTFVAEIT